MKIAIVGQKGIPSKSGGVETHVDNLSVHLARAGHEVFVYTRSNYTNKNLKYYQGVNLISLPNFKTKHFDAISHTFVACLDLIFKRRVDIIHFHSIGPSSLIWFLRIFKPGTPIVFTFHSKCYEHQKWGIFARNYLKISEYFAIKFSHKTIAISNSLVQYVNDIYGIKPKLIPNAVNLKSNSTGNKIKKWGLKENNYILSVSRIMKIKGIHYLIEAYEQLDTDKKLVIVGDGAIKDQYVQELKKRAQRNKNIIFTGIQSGETLEELFSNAYLFVQSSESEGLSISLLEAMSYGKCALVSNIRGNLEAIGGNGQVFKSKNILSLKKQMDKLLKNPKLVNKTGKLARERVEINYNWEKNIQEVVDLYDDLIKQAQEKRNLSFYSFIRSKID